MGGSHRPQQSLWDTASRPRASKSSRGAISTLVLARLHIKTHAWLKTVSTADLPRKPGVLQARPSFSLWRHLPAVRPHAPAARDSLYGQAQAGKSPCAPGSLPAAPHRARQHPELRSHPRSPHGWPSLLPHRATAGGRVLLPGDLLAGPSRAPICPGGCPRPTRAPPTPGAQLTAKARGAGRGLTTTPSDTRRRRWDWDVGTRAAPSPLQTRLDGALSSLVWLKIPEPQNVSRDGASAPSPMSLLVAGV